MSPLRAALPVAIITALVPLPGLALERTSVRMSEGGPRDEWAAGATCTMSYYNTCTEWLWVWTGWENEDLIGVTMDPCCSSDAVTLVATNQYAWNGASCDMTYGYTGLVSIHEMDANGCPGTLLASQPLCPRTGDNVLLWNVPVTGSIVLRLRHQTVNGNPHEVHWATDHPAAGPAGPPACGSCFPTNRVTHSFKYGKVSAPLCPGSPFDDGVCNAELLWSAAFACPTDVEPSSWGSIKGLYR